MAEDRAYRPEDLDETEFSIAEYLTDDLLPQCATSGPAFSMDFNAFGGLQPPRDGFQRPVLVPPSPPSNRRAAPRRRDVPPTVHVTHVHKTLVQTAAPTAVATPIPAAPAGSSLECLEASLSVRPGSVSRPASRWFHQSKATRASFQLQPT